MDMGHEMILSNLGGPHTNGWAMKWIYSTTVPNVLSDSVGKLSIATGHAMQIYNCLGQLRQFSVNLHSMTCCYA